MSRVLYSLVVLGACSTPSTGVAPDAAIPNSDADVVACTTRISYGESWIRGADHPANEDVADGNVTWDGTCVDDGANSYAVLSNGWQPYFTGNAACKIAIDQATSCGGPTECTTRITYGTTWLSPPGHTANHDDVAGRVFWDGTCGAAGADSVATLSNGWAPHFSGSGTCAMSFRWDSCGGLYANPVIPMDCADPGVVRDGETYVLSCTSGNASDAFPLFVSTDLVTWTPRGHILPSAERPAWATSDYWAPEIHPVGSHWVAYFSARNTDGQLSIGAASAPNALGPYTALAQPLIHDAAMGLIDANQFTASDGTPYLVWKADGNAVGQPTPNYASALSSDGLALTGARATLITNDRAWEGNLVEGAFVVERGGMFYLFYSGNAYYDARYAVGVARASSPLGPYTKQPDPIVATGGAWYGPGHCSVVDGPGGDSYMVYHAWRTGQPEQGRLVLTDQVVWRDGWPIVPASPSSTSRPRP